MKPFILLVCICSMLSGCGLYWIRGEQRYCRDCDKSYYGYECPICGEDYYLQDKLTGKPVNMTDGNGMVFSGSEIIGHEDEKMPDGKYRFR